MIEGANPKKLYELVHFSGETWDGCKYFTDTFPYIEISEIDTVSGEIGNISNVETADAPSRAKMIVRKGDVIVSTTRPNRGAISFLREPEYPVQIASTGFCVLRKLKTDEISKEYLYYALRQNFSLTQMEQRSSGGNYPAITSEELKKILIPIPSTELQEKVSNIFDKAFAEKKFKDVEVRSKLRSVDEVVLDTLGIILPDRGENTLASRMFFTKSGNLTGGRTDPHAQHSERIKAVEAVLSSKFPVEPLHLAAEFVSVQTNTNLLNQPYLGLDSIQSNTGVYQPKGEEPEEFGTANIFKRDNILFPKLRPYLNKIFYATFDGVCSTEFHVLNGVKVSSEFLAIFLRTSIVVNQTKRLMTGNTLPRLQTSDIEALLIPIPPPHVQDEIVEKVNAIYAEAKQLREEGSAILESAKAEVERMILGG